MKGTRTINQLHLIFFLVFFFQFSFAQLSSFSLVVTKTDETCTGNGSLSFNVQNTSPGATIIYSIYLLPNVTTPIAVTQSNSLTGLNAGNYSVNALQSLGALSNSVQQGIEINNLIESIAFDLSGQPQTCQNNGGITVNVTNGNPSTYEIISGPIIVSPQSSNIFTNLISGVYNIRVNDVCGDGVVQTYTLSSSINSNLTISPFSTVCQLTNCNTIDGSFLIQALLNTTISYPLNVVFTVQPPSGAPISFNQVIATGAVNVTEVNLNIPFYYNQSYSYNIVVTDTCNNIATYNGVINKTLTLGLTQPSPSSCQRGIELNLCNFVPPYTVNFISSPQGFNPTIFNPNHPGPFIGETSYNPTINEEMPLGNYIIEVTDSCGHVAQSQITLLDGIPDFQLMPFDDCSPTSIINIPNVSPPVTSVIITAAPVQANLSLPFVAYTNPTGGLFNMSLNFSGIYTFTGTNICGATFSFDVEVPPYIPPTLSVIGNAYPGCNLFNGYINVEMSTPGPELVTVLVTDAPIAYGNSLPHDISQYISQPNNVSLTLGNLPVGSYTFSVVDSCGNTYVETTIVSVVISQTPLAVSFLKGCGGDVGSLTLASYNGGLQTVIINSAPSTFTQTLPYDVSFNIASNGWFYMNSLPIGTYTFYTKDICNVEIVTTIEVSGYQVIQDEILVEGSCGAFNLGMQYIVNELSTHFYWLQKWNPISNQWEHPITGTTYINGTLPTVLNSYSLSNLTVNYNIASLGTFRIIKTHEIFSNGVSTLLNCIEVIREFEFNGGLKITSAYTFPCNNSNEVIIIANGIPPLTYRITSKDGLPFVVNNGTSNIFSGLQPGIYNFQVQDTCGNIVNRLFDITTLPEPSITASNLCQGQSGELSVQAFSFLNYQWWKGTNTTTILSTTNVLTFNPFNGVTDAGTYYVRIYSTIPGSYVDRILSYTIPLSTIPNAGLDGNLVLCGTSNSVNLFTLLNGTYDTGGVWQEITNSGMLSGNNWLPLGIPYGVYNFKYTVSGFCNAIDESFISITFNPIPMDPIVDVDSNYCSGDDIQFFTETIPNATYQWTGPNGFTATTQNLVFNDSTTILSGNYTVTANLNGCTSSTTKTILVKPIPQFTIEANCINNNFTITAIPANGTFSSSDTFLWSGPDGFTSTINPIQISNKPKGIYSVVVTNIDGCSTFQSVEVLSTMCTIPNGISPNDDGLNDSFDLSGFTGIRELKIFNRYGMVVYEQENYIDQWHGQQKNSDKLLPDGTYYYLINFENSEPKTGWVYLVREY
ncbi:gliding motility-associated C-terminal domain-containing protein [Flavobacterium sp.]|jgi:gliding motility-associated-like protein|uniref:gliding motility-associated C-terminal domain-containing protein n=1 Tax=Flavobacterium sp. TaxID=239 RepID=UPI0037BF83DC